MKRTMLASMRDERCEFEHSAKKIETRLVLRPVTSMLNMDGGDYIAIKAILDAEHQKWKEEREASKTWGKRETRKERIKRRRKEQEARTRALADKTTNCVALSIR